MNISKITLILFVPMLLSLACSLTVPVSPTPAASTLIIAGETNTPEHVDATQAIPSVTPQQTTNCEVTANALHLRACAGVDCLVKGWLSVGTQLTILSVDNGWLQVETPAGATGWINGKYCGDKP